MVENPSLSLFGGVLPLLIRISGPTDGKTFSLLGDFILRLNQRGYLHFIADMSQLKMVCSTGLGSLVRIVDQLESRNGEVVFFGFPGKIPQLLDMLGLSVLLKALDSEEEAIEYFGNR